MGYTASVFIYPSVNVIDKEEMPLFCVLQAGSCPAAEQKAIFP